MIDLLDILLRKLITSSVVALASDDQVRFQPLPGPVVSLCDAQIAKIS